MTLRNKHIWTRLVQEQLANHPEEIMYLVRVQNLSNEHKEQYVRGADIKPVKRPLLQKVVTKIMYYRVMLPLLPRESIFYTTAASIQMKTNHFLSSLRQQCNFGAETAVLD